MTEVRILVTGSRDWTDRGLVWAAIESYLAERGLMNGEMPIPGTSIVIVHGGCREGADSMAADWALLHGVRDEVWPADWQNEHDAAGPRRNARMVKAGADVCLAFGNRCRRPACKRYAGALHWTHGTDDCAARARGARIPVRSYGVPWEA